MKNVTMLSSACALLFVFAAGSVVRADDMVDILLEDNGNFSQQKIGYNSGDLYLSPKAAEQPVCNLNFSRCDIASGAFSGHLKNASFRGAEFRYRADLEGCLFEHCDFAETQFRYGAVFGVVDEYTWKTMGFYVRKNLQNITLVLKNNKPMDFSQWEIDHGAVTAELRGKAHPMWKFDDAKICRYTKPAYRQQNSLWLHREQFETTFDYKAKTLAYIWFHDGGIGPIDEIKNRFNAKGLSLKGFRLLSCEFSNLDGIETIDFTDAVLTNCDLSKATKLTSAQIESTWNYKTGNMDGIKLPRHFYQTSIQEAVEREAKK